MPLLTSHSGIGVQRGQALEHLRRVVLDGAPSQLRSPGGCAAPVPTVPTGATSLDEALGGGLRRGVVHEWMAAHPPLGVLIPLVLRAATKPPESSGSTTTRLLVWIGRRCWPNPRALPAWALEHSLFVDPTDRDELVWAIDLAARSTAVAALVADGRAMSMSQSRRVQLASAASGRALVLLARPIEDEAALSAAWTRWRVEPTPNPNPTHTPDRRPRWRLALRRARGLATGDLDWMVTTHATGLVDLADELGDRSASPAWHAA